MGTVRQQLFERFFKFSFQVDTRIVFCDWERVLVRRSGFIPTSSPQIRMVQYAFFIARTVAVRAQRVPFLSTPKGFERSSSGLGCGAPQQDTDVFIRKSGFLSAVAFTLEHKSCPLLKMFECFPPESVQCCYVISDQQLQIQMLKSTVKKKEQANYKLDDEKASQM